MTNKYHTCMTGDWSPHCAHDYVNSTLQILTPIPHPYCLIPNPSYHILASVSETCLKLSHKTHAWGLDTMYCTCYNLFRL